MDRKSCWGALSVMDLQDGGCGVLVTCLWRGGQDGAVGVPLLQAVPHQLRYLQHPAGGRPRRVSLHVPACCAASLKRLQASHGTVHSTPSPAQGCCGVKATPPSAMLPQALTQRVIMTEKRH